MVVDTTNVASDILKRIDKTPYDKESVPQEKLDLDDKTRSSLFPWRGQFSPMFIELLLNEYSKPNDIVLDPFAGSGTTLFESANKNLTCFGAELNPSAVLMSKTAQFVNVPLEERKNLGEQAKVILDNIIKSNTWDLFSSLEDSKNNDSDEVKSMEELFKEMLNETDNYLILHILANAFVRYKNYRKANGKEDMEKALNEHLNIVNSLPFIEKECFLFHTDARNIPLADNTVNLVITSPPYINVFNYHQNNRPQMELLGWDLLEVAKSEMGSNRKHRQNRFLTAIQYSMDIFDTLLEINRLLKDDGRMIIIVGRESKIRGTSLKNGRLVAALAVGAGFDVERIQERKFLNKFGETIYEDIIHLLPAKDKNLLMDSFSRDVAVEVLREASLLEENKDVQSELLDAINKVEKVKKSPIFEQPINHSEQLENKCFLPLSRLYWSSTYLLKGGE
ncbi:site-specific DNA-methyltransferase [bacterium LRH843]|nr:site-specific DNA-methyltransferase [bacterium LRH843]